MKKTSSSTPPDPQDHLRVRAKRLGLYGLLACWLDIVTEPWLLRVLQIEEAERSRRSLDRRLRSGKIGGFKPMADFDWNWPEEIDRELVEDLFTFQFMEEKANVVMIGPNGIGKTMIAKNLAHEAAQRGFSVLHTTASEMLNDLAAQDSSGALTRRLRRYTSPALLVIDEVGYLSYNARHGDLLFEVVSRRHQERPIILSTNKVFDQWNEAFPNSSCVTALIDRLVHRAEIVNIKGESYRVKEAKERNDGKAKARRSKRKGEKEKSAE